MSGFNGWTPIAKKVGIWGGAITVTAFIVSWLHTKVVVEPAASAATSSVKDAVEKSELRIRHQIYGEGVVRDTYDSLQMVRIGNLEKVVAEGVYSRKEIDAMRARDYRRQDSLFRAVSREAKRR